MGQSYVVYELQGRSFEMPCIQDSRGKHIRLGGGRRVICYSSRRVRLQHSPGQRFCDFSLITVSAPRSEVAVSATSEPLPHPLSKCHFQTSSATSEACFSAGLGNGVIREVARHFQMWR